VWASRSSGSHCSAGELGELERNCGTENGEREPLRAEVDAGEAERRDPDEHAQANVIANASGSVAIRFV